MGMLTGIPFDEIAIGQPVKLVVEVLFRNDEQVNVLTCKFGPQADETDR
jgi:hypothetical protein